MYFIRRRKIPWRLELSDLNLETSLDFELKTHIFDAEEYGNNIAVHEPTRGEQVIDTMKEPDLLYGGIQDPELVFGLVGALGSPLEKIYEILRAKLAGVSYSAEKIRLSEFLPKITWLETPLPINGDPPAKRLELLMTRGNELRKVTPGALAMLAALEIYRKRPNDDPKVLQRQAFVIHQLKHPEEVTVLRRIYGDSFHLIGVHTPEHVRNDYLRRFRRMDSVSAVSLITRDAGEEQKFGQQVTKTFYRSDLILRCKGWRDNDLKPAEEQIDRYLDLLFGRKIHSPTMDEYGMFLAHAASLRSADLSRQVGAAILTTSGEVISLGTNEVPKAGGGQYWGEPGGDRDFERGYDSNKKVISDTVREVVQHIKGEEWKGEKLSEEETEARIESIVRGLGHSRLMNLTEFGRAVHAEMEAILAAARLGIAVRRQVLYSTTFPCHNCAKHIVGAGLSRVIYVEPYPKSLADQLHDDAISFDKNQEEKVLFEPFYGVTPRRFAELFSVIEKDGSSEKRQDDDGNVRPRKRMRTGAYPFTHINRETEVARYLSELKILHEQSKSAKEEGQDESGRNDPK